MKRGVFILRIAAALMFFAVMFLVSSCRSIELQPVERVLRDTCYLKHMEIDSIYERDSIFVYTRSDTVYNTRVQWRFRDRVVRDTIYRMRTDTVTNVVRVEKQLTAWQKTKMEAGGYAIVCSAILVAIWFAKRLKGL